MKRSPSRGTKSTAGLPSLPRDAARPSGGPSSRPGGVPLRAQHIKRAQRDIERGVKDSERRGVPNDVPAKQARK